MSTSIRPVWVEITGEPFTVNSIKSWPFLPTPSFNSSEIEDLAQSFLQTPTRLFSAKTTSTAGYIHLQYHQSVPGYRGIWIPESFPMLNSMIKPLLEEWHEEIPTFEEWIQRFFRLRLEVDYLQYFQSGNNYGINLPPLYVLNQKQITNHLLPVLQDKIRSSSKLSIELMQDIIEGQLSEQMLELVKIIDCELDISVIHLFQEYMYSLEEISPSDFERYYGILAKISSDLTEYILINYYSTQLNHNKELDEKVGRYLEQKEQEEQGMMKIMLLRVLLRLYQTQDEIIKQEEYYKKLLKFAPQYSWNSRLDLVNAQLGLARCSVTRGNYFRALTFYSFARQGITTLGASHVNEEMEIEYQRISVLSANQQLQSGLYAINHNQYDKNTFLTLIDGIQGAFTHYIRYPGQNIPLERILPPILKSAATTLKLHQDKVGDLFPTDLDYDRFIETVDQLDNSNRGPKVLKQLQLYIEELSFKDQKMVETISIFYEDGRHIGDYQMEAGEFVQMQQDSTQSLFSSAMSAVNMLITEATQSDSTVEEISVGNKKVIYETGEHLTFCLISKSSNANLKQLLRQIGRTVETEFASHLNRWNGNLSPFQNLSEYLSPLSYYTIDRGI